VNIHHNHFFNENSLYDSNAVWETLKKLEQNGYTYKALKAEVTDNTKDEDEETDGKIEATWFRSSTFGDRKDRVLVKGTGEPTYTLPDIAYHVNKIERGFDLLVNILGADHYVQHQVVKYGVKALGLDPAPIQVIIIQLVRTVRDGQVVRMSTRKGDYDTLDDLIDQTSADAVRYILLARNANSHLDFDIDLAVKQSNENPVYYIQNAHVRCAGIFREAAARGVSDEGADVSLLGDTELAFVRRALEIGEQIEFAARELEPHRIAFYAMELAAIFHPIYDNVRALHTEVPTDVQKARLRFYRAAQVVFKRVLTLMGMTAPEVM
jgi:arginyl-tRNA synthetase